MDTLWKINLTFTMLYVLAGFFVSRRPGLNNPFDWFGGVCGLVLVILWPLYAILWIWL